MSRGQKSYSFDAFARFRVCILCISFCLPLMIFQCVMLDFLPIMPQVLIPTRFTSL